jgi:hypothetical protein
MSCIHYQQSNVQRVDECAASVAASVPGDAGLSAKRITAAVLLLICIVAAAFL